MYNHFDFNVLKSLKTTTTASKKLNIRQKSRKCLFGATNQEETYQMVKENFDQEKERFFYRFGIHMEDLDRLAIDEDEYKKNKLRPVMPAPAPSSSHVGGGKITNKKTIRMKRALKPYNANNQPSTHQTQQQQQQQMKITGKLKV